MITQEKKKKKKFKSADSLYGDFGFLACTHTKLRQHLDVKNAAVLSEL